jgi:hypothetical protein
MMHGVMKSCAIALAAVFLFLPMRVSAAKAYDGWSTWIRNSSVNQNKVRVIEGTATTGDRAYFMTFTCNDQDRTCFAPQVGQRYTLSEAFSNYQCDEYTLHRPNEPSITVCLLSVD